MSKERVASLIFFFTGIYGLIFSIQLPIGKWKEPGPGVFPLSLSILLVISGILWFIHGKRKEREKEWKIDWYGIVKRFVTPLKILGLTLAFILVLERMGYLLASLFYTFVLFFWVSRYRLWICLGLAIAIGVGSWFFFVKILAVQLPRGLLPR